MEVSRIGVVSDTHNNLANVARIVELFNAAGVDRVVHTGDITQAKTRVPFAAMRTSKCRPQANPGARTA